MEIQLLSKKKSKAAKVLLDNTRLKRVNNKRKKPDLLINYGIAGKQKQRAFKRYPYLKNIPVINYICGYNKYKAVKIVEDEGIKVPKSKKTLNKSDDMNSWLLKKYHSYGGKDIYIADRKTSLKDFYYQKFINNRVFELRVHAFSWVPVDNWVIQKRISTSNTIAWNYSAGGRFTTLKERDTGFRKEILNTSSQILTILGMEFGAVDFIVDKKLNLYFIEINSQPGFSGLSDNIYIDSFNLLFSMTLIKIKSRFNH